MHVFNNELCRQALTVINSLHYYFLKYNKDSVDLAELRVLHHVLLHYNKDTGNLAPYIKKLARTIGLSMTPKKEVSGELIELTLSDSTEDVSGSVIAIMDDFMDKVHSLAISYMHYFLSWGHFMFIERRKPDKACYFPMEFRNICLTLSRQNENFLPYSEIVYKQYGQAMQDFEDYANLESNWKEADYSLLNSQASKRVYFVDSQRRPLERSGEMYLNLDKLDGYIAGKLGDKRIIRIKYTDIWDLMCALIDSEDDNQMRITIGNYYVIRTLGGSFSLPNVDVQSMFDLCLNEIATNLTLMTLGRYMGQGLDYMYFIVNDMVELPVCKAMGLSFEFRAEDVTHRFKQL